MSPYLFVNKIYLQVWVFKISQIYVWVIEVVIRPASPALHCLSYYLIINNYKGFDKDLFTRAKPKIRPAYIQHILGNEIERTMTNSTLRMPGKCRRLRTVYGFCTEFGIRSKSWYNMHVVVHRLPCLPVQVEIIHSCFEVPARFVRYSGVTDQKAREDVWGGMRKKGIDLFSFVETNGKKGSFKSVWSFVKKTSATVRQKKELSLLKITANGQKWL